MHTQPHYRWEEMTPHEFEEIIAETPVAYVPLGLLEWHGNHLPLGTDMLKIVGIVERIARRTGGIVLPPCIFGRPGYGNFYGTMIFSDELIYRLLMELCAQLDKCGFRVIALLTGHYGSVQVEMVKRVAADYMARSHVTVLAQPEYEGIDPPPADHAGKWETSFSLSLYPHLVHMEAFHPGLCPIKRYGPDHISFPEEDRPWVWREDLRQIASAAEGEAMIERIADHIAARVIQALEKNQ